MPYSIKNWADHQHYKTGRAQPSWIKLYKKLLDDPEWFSLPPEAAKFLISIWLLASETGGVLPASTVIAFRLRIDSKKVDDLLKACHHWLSCDASEMLANGYHDASPEQNREEQNRTEINGSSDKSDCPTCPVEEIVSVYHKTLPTLRRVIVLSEKRKTLVRQRWRECHQDGDFKDREGGIEAFTTYFGIVARSNFLLGRVKSERPFQADFEWLMNSSNFIKVIEGKYGN